MSVLIETSLGDIVVDLYYKQCPKAYQNFISLCRLKYYNNCLFFNIQRDFIAQTGDPTNTGQGGHSIFHLLHQEQHQQQKQQKSIKNELYFEDEVFHHLKHDRKGLLCMANQNRPHTNSSQFYFTTTDRHLDYLDMHHTIFGEVAEGISVLDAINEAYTDKDGKPYQVIRIKHTHILYDAIEEEDNVPSLIDLNQLRRMIPPNSPTPTPQSVYEELGYLIPEEGTATSTVTNNNTTSTGSSAEKVKSREELEEEMRMREGRSRALILEMIGDLPSADLTPPDNVLFVCKLNPVTKDSDLAIIFSRFGTVVNCEIIRDHKTGESLCYGFVEMDSVESCERAFVKMQNVVIDDRRIHVDFSQSVAKLWNRHYTKGHQKKNKKETKDRISSSSSSHRHRDDDDDDSGHRRQRYERSRDDDRRHHHRDHHDREHGSRKYGHRERETRDDRRDYHRSRDADRYRGSYEDRTESSSRRRDEHYSKRSREYNDAEMREQRDGKRSRSETEDRHDDTRGSADRRHHHGSSSSSGKEREEFDDIHRHRDERSQRRRREESSTSRDSRSREQHSR